MTLTTDCYTSDKRVLVTLDTPTLLPSLSTTGMPYLISLRSHNRNASQDRGGVPLPHQWYVDTVSSSYCSKRHTPTNKRRKILCAMTDIATAFFSYSYTHFSKNIQTKSSGCSAWCSPNIRYGKLPERGSYTCRESGRICKSLQRNWFISTIVGIVDECIEWLIDPLRTTLHQVL